MIFADEHELEAPLRHLITSRITAKNPHIYALENKKAVDIVICRDGQSPALFFLEVKLFKAENNRLGIGGGTGKGYQPEIAARLPIYFESHLRWIIVDGTASVVSFLFLPTSVLRQYLAKGEVGQKQNNIQLRVFREQPGFDEKTLIDELSNWLST